MKIYRSVDLMLVACQSCHLQYDVGGMKAGEMVRCRCGRPIKVPQKKAHHAKLLHCSSCGAQLRQKKSTCDYCGGEITKSERNLGSPCPECFARLRKGAKFCSECGIEIRPVSIKSIRMSAHCPRCKGSLVLHELQDGHYTECSSCAGIWLDCDSFQEVIEKREESSLGKIFSKKKIESAENDDHPVRYLPCPTCGEFMHRKNFGGCSGVVIDWCKHHGFWFDTDELEKVISFISSGGMQKARRLQIENEKAELKRLKENRGWATTVLSREDSGVYLGSGGGYFDRPGQFGRCPEMDLVSSLREIWSSLTNFFKK